MHSKTNVTILEHEKKVNKTAILEKGIGLFPSVYVEGAAALGKTTAVKMLLAEHPEVQPHFFSPNLFAESEEMILQQLRSLVQHTEKEQTWIVIDMQQEPIKDAMANAVVRFVNEMPENAWLIVVSRECLPAAFLDLVWKRKMMLASQEHFLFTQDDVIDYVNELECPLDPIELYEETGGWAGCVDLMMRLAYGQRKDVRMLRKSYEVDTYIGREMLSGLNEKEQEMMKRAAICPWLDEALCRDFWHDAESVFTLEMLGRKGMLRKNPKRLRWEMAPLFRHNYLKKTLASEKPTTFWKLLSQWYEQHDYLYEAAICLEDTEEEELYKEFLLKHYYEIPYAGVLYRSVLEWESLDPRVIYLRGTSYYFFSDTKNFQKEMKKLENWQELDREGRQIYLNMRYLDQDTSLDEWLELLDQMCVSGEQFSLFGMLGGSVTFLCGFRDLTELFACAKKDENRKMRIWKTKLGLPEWRAYQLARIDYYVETGRMKQIKEEDRQLLEWSVSVMRKMEREEIKIRWQFRLAGLYILYKCQMLDPNVVTGAWIPALENSLLEEESATCRKNTEALKYVFAVWRGGSEKMTYWLRQEARESYHEIRENQFYYLVCQTNCYLLIGQYEKARRLNERLIPYLRKNKRQRYLAELLFQQAIVYYEKNEHMMALKYMSESFYISSECRYVTFYASYGKRGENVLKHYVSWLQDQMAEAVTSKKKYNYGNVVRMPFSDYMNVILRTVKKENRSMQPFFESVTEEHLTMTETLVLQHLGKGLSNDAICKEMNLKLSTVKSHIYSLYKKLGVKNRIQAVLKAKEIGIISENIEKTE